MPMFKKISKPFEAFQLPQEGQVCSDAMVEFLNDANVEIDNLGDGSIEIFDNLSCEEWKVDPGDWIYKQRGFLFVHTQEYFQKNYSSDLKKGSDDEIKDVVDDALEQLKHDILIDRDNHGHLQICQSAATHFIDYLKAKGFIIIPSPDVSEDQNNG